MAVNLPIKGLKLLIQVDDFMCSYNHNATTRSINLDKKVI